MRLTVRSVEAARPKPVRQEIPDSLLGGLYLVVQPSGSKGWAVRYRHHGTPRKFTLGSFPAIDLKTARELAAKALRRNAEGIDPAQEKKLARIQRPDSIDRLVEEFLDRHVRRECRPRHAIETERLLRKYVLPRWRGLTVSSVTRRDVIDVVDTVAGDTPVQANRILASIRKMFAWALSRDIVAASPCAGVKRPTAEHSRNRVLSDSEICLVWEAAGKLGGPFGALTRLLLVTGQRRDEVAKMRRDELNVETRLWTLSGTRTKNGQAHEVPLSSAALAIIEGMPPTDGYILSKNGGASPAQGYSENKRKIDELSGVTSWTLHDLRRTCATGMAKLGVPIHVSEAVLNHRSGTISGVAAVYNRFDYADEKVEALAAWGRHVDALVSGKPANVVRLREKRP